MNRCKSCRHWQAEPEPRVTISKPRRGYCQMAESKDGYATHSDSLSVAQGSNQLSYLVTAETFGCVQWAARDQS